MRSAALEWLYGLEQFGIKFGLENISTIVDALGHPERAFRSVHVAGTNGKGSVTALVESVLRAAGYPSARYTSPHLVDLSERFYIRGNPVDPKALDVAIGDLRSIVDGLRSSGHLAVYPTFFEVTTALAFELFRRAKVELAVCEVGLGGRLDATNILVPEVSAITSIGLDHEQYLGTTLREIAIEKAGIIKPGVPVVLGRLLPAAREAIVEIARSRGAPIVESTDAANVQKLTIALRGAHQTDNAGVALKILEALDARGVAVSRSAIADGFAHVSWPGRLDVRRLPGGRSALLDAAHNPDGARALAAYLRTSEFAGAPLVFGAMRDKDIEGILRELAPETGTVLMTRASSTRAADPSELAARMRSILPTRSVEVVPTPAEAVDAAWRLSNHIVVAGSIFLLGDLLKDGRWS
jgi:dihydrofolate synthase / folylpolyglutamate synthase